jgi:hypothetical protein
MISMRQMLDIRSLKPTERIDGALQPVRCQACIVFILTNSKPYSTRFSVAITKRLMHIYVCVSLYIQRQEVTLWQRR